MTEGDELPRRALSMMQALAGAYAKGQVPEGPSRNIVSREVALDAVMQLFAVIDEPLQAGDSPPSPALHGMAMLMLLREHILALPDPPGAEELLRSDLRSLAGALDDGRDVTGDRPVDA